MNDQLTATITRTTQLTPDVVELRFLVDGGVLPFQAGQYITVYFNDTSVKEGKAYSLSSIPTDPYMGILVKKIGLFSSKLHALRVGDNLKVSRPYGFFNTGSQKPIIALAAGVGLAPIWSVIRSLLVQGDQRSIKLLYSNRTMKDVVLAKQLAAASRIHPNFSLQLFITRQTQVPAQVTARRIQLTADAATAADVTWYVCGSTEFVGAMWRTATAAGVSEDAIATETFFEV